MGRGRGVVGKKTVRVWIRGYARGDGRSGLMGNRFERKSIIYRIWEGSGKIEDGF